jgi:quercetin dioxygenase-like cupin family protein
MSQMDAVRTETHSALPAPFTVLPEQQRPLNVVGEQLTVLASGAQTGSYEIFRQVGPEGSGPPPHTHPWDESFYVINGDITFHVDGREQVAVPGTLVHFPAGTVHAFQFGDGGGEMLSMTSREAASHLFTELDREVPPEAPDFAKLVEISVRHGMEIHAPPG